jgi:hypothetical protein
LHGGKCRALKPTSRGLHALLAITAEASEEDRGAASVRVVDWPSGLRAPLIG